MITPRYSKYNEDYEWITPQNIRDIELIIKDGTSKNYIARQAGYSGRSNTNSIKSILDGTRKKIHKDTYKRLVVFLELELKEIKKRNSKEYIHACKEHKKIYDNGTYIDITSQTKKDIQTVLDSGVSQSHLGSQFGYYGSSGRTTVYDILNGTRKRIHKDNHGRLVVFLRNEINRINRK